jgi:DNA-binding transcriptional MerR regulator
VGLSWTEFVSGYKSRLSALARSCFLRRRHWQQKTLEAKQALRESQELLDQCEARCRQLEQQQEDLRQQVAELQRQVAEPRPVLLPVGETPPGQHYGANLMALLVNLGRELGIRPAQRATKIFSRG